jgi:hypothetical protein
LLLGLVVLAGARPAATLAAEPVPSTRALAAERAMQMWCTRLAEHVAVIGQGDLAVLAELPALRSPAHPRPTQIVFGVTDIDAIEAGRDGYDAVGLMVGRHVDAASIAYVFVVGVVERQAHRPVALVDVRAVAISLRDGRPAWIVGPADARVLARYEHRRDADTALRFPAALDQFVLVACASGTCVEERASGARWSLY